MIVRTVSFSRRFSRHLTGTVLPLAALLLCSSPLWAQAKATPEVKALLDQARAARTAHKNDTALDLYTQARSRAQDTEDTVGEAAALAGTGNIYSDLGQNDKATTAYEQALRLYTTGGDKPNAAIVQLNLGRIYTRTGDTTRALDVYQKALPVFQNAGNKASEAATLSGLGGAYLKQEQFAQAASAYQQAVGLYHGQGSQSGEGFALSGQGEAYRRQGQAAKAVPLYEQALSLFRSVGDKANEALVLSNLGAAYVSDGYISLGAETYAQAQALYTLLGDVGGQAQTLSAMADAYLSIGQNAKALAALQQAGIVFRDRKDTVGEADVQLKLGQTYRQLSQPTNAIAAYQRAQALSHSSGNIVTEALALTGMGKVYFATDQCAKALKPYQQALALFRTSGDRSNEAVTLTNIGSAYLNTNDVSKALQYYKQSLPIYADQADTVGAARVLGHIGEVEAELGHMSNALTAYAQAVSNLEKVRVSLGGETAGQLSPSDRDIYQACLQLFLEQKKTADAFAIAQKLKAFTLSGIIRSAIPALDAAALAPDEQRQLSDAQQEIAGLNRQLSPGNSNPVSVPKAQRVSLTTERRSAVGKSQTLTAALYARYPALADAHLAKRATLAEIARLLPGDTALLEYVQTAPDSVTLFTVTRGATGMAQVAATTIPLTANLRQHCAAFQAACTDPRKPYQPLARQLYTALLAPVQKQLAGKKRLVICPDGSLWDVPFQALLVPGDRFVNQAWEVDYAPGASQLQVAWTTRQRDKTRPAPANTLLVLASPDLGSADRLSRLDDVAGPLDTDKPSRQMAAALTRSGKFIPLSQSQQEADAISGVFPGTTLLAGDKVQEPAVAQNVGGYRYLHAATYSFLSDTAPLASNLVLSQPSPPSGDTDGFLTLSEICTMNLNTELVTLSACGTGSDSVHPGDGMQATNWAWLAAGVPTQIVSRWIADTPTTPTIMSSFYAAFKSGGSKGEALRKATLTLIQDKAHQHPFYWASFTLLGDWR